MIGTNFSAIHIARFIGQFPAGVFTPIRFSSKRTQKPCRREYIK
jgi:hypothetical protein